jgi:hypothetical protein
MALVLYNETEVREGHIQVEPLSRKSHCAHIHGRITLEIITIIIIDITPEDF